MLKPLIYFSLLSLSTLTLAQLPPNEVLNQWAVTQINFEGLIYGSINDESCLKTEATFFGCLNALNKALEIKDPENTYFILPDDSSTDPLPGFTAEKASYSFEDLKKQKLDYQKQVLQIYRELNSAGYLKRPVQFSRATAQIESQYRGKKEEAYITGIIYNAYLLGAYDPHTYVKPLKEFRKTMSSHGTVKLYGIEYRVVDFEGEPRLAIIGIDKDSPGQASGLTRGDVFLSINDKTDPKDMAQELQTKDSIKVEVIGRTGSRSLQINRAEFENQQVSLGVVKGHNGRKFLRIRIKAFAEDICGPIRKAGNKIKRDKDIDGVIIDLRNNPGGLTEEAKCLHSLFLEKYSYIWVQRALSATNFNKEVLFFPENLFNDLHTVTLINGRSASASEAFASFVQGYRKSFILGERSFGKGTQQLIGPDSKYPELARAQTRDKYYGPHGVSPQLQGITPDFEVYPNYGQSGPSTFYRERDRYENVIVNESQRTPMMGERFNQIAQIKDCLKTSGAVENEYQSADRFEQLVFDQQLSSAQGVLDCALDLNIPVFKGTRIPTVKDF